MKDTLVFWFTGLSGAGKTTIANAVSAYYRAMGKEVKIFDGDVVRQELNKNLGFTPEDIKENNRLIAQFCRDSGSECDMIFVPIISPFIVSRESAANVIGDGFRLVYIKSCLQTVQQRDVKGLYQKALAGEIKNFIGIDPEVPYEVPESPDCVLDTDQECSEESINNLIRYINMELSKTELVA